MHRIHSLSLFVLVVIAAAAHAAPPPAQAELKKSLSETNNNNNAPIVVAAATEDVVPLAETPSPFHPSNSDIVGLSKRIYASLGSKSAADLAQDFKGEYETLNVDGLLGPKLDALYEMRLEDLQLSVRHAKKMRDLLDVLEQEPTAPLDP